MYVAVVGHVNWEAIPYMLPHSVHLKNCISNNCRWPHCPHDSVMYQRYLLQSCIYLWGESTCFLGTNFLCSCKRAHRRPLSWKNNYISSNYLPWLPGDWQHYVYFQFANNNICLESSWAKHGQYTRKEQVFWKCVQFCGWTQVDIPPKGFGPSASLSLPKTLRLEHYKPVCCIRL